MTAEVVYTAELDGIGAEHLEGFFVDWPAPPSREHHLRILQGSDHVVLARDPGGRVVGFATAISDGALAAYIPLLEVLPAWQGRGIGTQLVRRLLERLRGLYMIDLVCDEELAPFYGRLGLTRVCGMALRDRAALGPPP